MEIDFACFVRYERPFVHLVDEAFLSLDEVREINAAWPDANDERWFHERRGYAQKSAIMFPKPLPEPVQSKVDALYSDEALQSLAAMIGVDDLLPDPWLRKGPEMPRVGGGLHEIHAGGLLGMHLDFSVHPTGLARTVTLLIYLNEDGSEEWGGALELGDGSVKIYPGCGVAVAFATTDSSWHGHPSPLRCPSHHSRRSLALYYYRKQLNGKGRNTTLYRDRR